MKYRIAGRATGGVSHCERLGVIADVASMRLFDLLVETVQGAQTINNESKAISELYNYASGNPALSVLGLAAELSQKPICLHQAYSDPLPKPDVQSAANEHGEGVVAGPSR